MPDTNDVNAQHLAAMGLADAPLGQPYADERSQGSQEGRCPALSAPPYGLQCARQEGHDGVHARGAAKWKNDHTDPTSRGQCGATTATGSCQRGLGHDGAHESGNAPEPTKQREGDQVLPSGGGDCVQDRVIADMEESKRVGLERYGSVLRTFNGRRSLVDVHEEVRDLFVYLTQVRMEAEADREALVEIVSKALFDKIGALFQGETGDAFCAEIAGNIVDLVMGWVAGQRDLAWAFRLIDCYYDGALIDFQGAAVPAEVQAYITEKERGR